MIIAFGFWDEERRFNKCDAWIAFDAEHELIESIVPLTIARKCRCQAIEGVFAFGIVGRDFSIGIDRALQVAHRHIEFGQIPFDHLVEWLVFWACEHERFGVFVAQHFRQDGRFGEADFALHLWGEVAFFELFVECQFFVV